MKDRVEALRAIANAGQIDDAVVLKLRREIFQDMHVCESEANALFEIDNAFPLKPLSWIQFKLEALTDYLVHQADPQGYISDENAAWLMQRIAKDGKVESQTELELLVKVLETAKGSPASLRRYALEQVAEAVVTGNGMIFGHKGKLEPGVINADEVQLLRRILHAMSGEGGLGISKDEAELLFKLNDQTKHDRNDASWNDLFVRAVANYVCGAARPALSTREEAKRIEAFLDAPTAGIGGMLAGMASLDGFKAAVTGLFDEPQSSVKALDDAAITASERVDAAEARWLVGKIGHDGEMHDNERELLKFINSIAGDIHDDLKPLIAQVA